MVFEGRSHKQRLSSAVVLLMLFGAASAPHALAQSGTDVVALNNDGVKALNASNFQLAIQKFEQALKLNPGYALARQNLAIAYNNYGLQLKDKPQEAIKMFHKALLLDPSNTTTQSNVSGIIRYMGRDPGSFQDRVELGDIARKSGDFTGAIVEYQAAVNLKPDAEVHEKLGDVYRVRDKLDKAIEQYSAAIRLKDSAALEVKLGQAYQANKDVANAIQAFGRAIKFNTSDPEVLDALVAGWEAALAANPVAPDNHIGLGQALQYRGDFEQAKQEYLQAIRFSPGRTNAIAEKLLKELPQAMKAAQIDKLINAGVDLQGRKKYDEAVAEYKQALELDPNNADVWVNLGTAYQAMKQFDQSLAAYQQAKKLDPQNKSADQGIKTATDQKQDHLVESLSKEGADLFKAQQYDQAIGKYMALLKIDPKDAATHFNLGAAYQAQKKYDEAISSYRLATKLDAENKSYAQALETCLDLKAQPLIDHGIAAHKEKNYRQAVSLYQQVLAFRPENDELWYNLASALYSMEDYRQAATAYQKAYDIDPKGRVDDLYFIATIEEHFGNGVGALAKYGEYLKNAPVGRYVQQANGRVAVLSKDATKVVKIKGEKEIAIEKDANDAFDKAVALQKNKQYDEAETLYKKAIALQPSNVDAIYGLGTLYQAMEKYDLALQFYANVQKLEPNNEDVKLAIKSAQQDQAQPLVDDAVKKQQDGDIPGAIASYKQAIALIPDNAKVWTNLAIALQQNDQYTEARNAYQKGYDLDAKGEVDNLYFMGPIDENAGNGANAMNLYREYMQKAPAGQYFAQAKSAYDRLSKNVADVEKLLTTGDRQKLDSADTAYQEGVKLQQSEKYDDAIAQYQKAAQVMPAEAAYPYAIATAYQAKGELDQAISFYQKAASLSKDSKQKEEIQKYLLQVNDLKVAPLLDEANQKYAAKDFSGAAAAYQNVLKVTPDNADAYTFLAASSQYLGNFAQALAAYKKAYDLDKSGKVDNLYFIAILDENDGNAAQAISHYELYLKQAPSGNYAALAQQRVADLRKNPGNLHKIVTAAEQEKSQEAQKAYADAVNLQQEEKYDEAIAAYKNALAISPSDPSFNYGMGTCYQAKGDLDEAMAKYQRAIELSPQEPAYKEALTGVKQLKAAPLLDSAYKKQTTQDAAGNYDLAGAIADYQAALKLNEDSSTYLNLGTAYQAKDDNQAALSAYGNAIRLDANQAEAYYYRGSVYEAMKQPALARKDYQKYVQLAPTGPNAADAKERLKVLAPPAAPRKR